MKASPKPENFGFSYGPCFRTIQELHIGNGYALARLDLAEELKGDFEQYILHPCIIDCALQTVIGVAMGGESNTPHLPFAVDEVEILRPLTQTCYAYVEQVVSETSVTSEIKQFNIRLLGENGYVRVKLNNFCVRALRNTPALEGDEAHGSTHHVEPAYAPGIATG